MSKEKAKLVDEPIKAIPLDQRQPWYGPALVFAGLEFCVPVMMIGTTLVANFSIPMIIVITFVAMVFITWPINTVSGYIGSKSGQSSSVVSRRSFGMYQARFIIGIAVAVVVLGHWGMQTAVAANSICAMFGVDYMVERTIWAVVVVITGLIFAIPSIMGFSSMKWTDYICVPAGLLLCIVGIYLAIDAIGFGAMIDYKPAAGGLTVLAGINLVVSLNSAQSMVAMDYTRFVKPTIKENIKVPFGIVGVGFPLVLVGSMMAVGHGTPDIVAVMTELGFPVWGFLVLWLSTWTSQIANNYSAGLGLCNTFNIDSPKGRKIVTLAATLFAIVLSLMGILEHFVTLYTVTGLVFPAMAGVMIGDFFLRRNGYEYDAGNWNWMATIALVIGGAVGIMTAYVTVIGIPALQTLVITILVYYFIMKTKLGAPTASTKTVEE